jgi:hypothetical protein
MLQTPPIGVSIVERRDTCHITILRGRVSRHLKVRTTTRRESPRSHHIMEE